MKRILIYIITFCFYFVISAQAPIRHYYTNMVNNLKPYFENSDTVYLDSLKGKLIPLSSFFDVSSDVGRANYRIKEIECLNDILDLSALYSDEIFFIHLSRGLLGLGEDTGVTGPSCCFKYHRIFTKKELSDIERFWKENEYILTPDLLQDAVFSKLRALNAATETSWYYVPLDKLNRERMAERIAYRKSRPIEKADSVCRADKYWIEPNFKLIHDSFIKANNSWIPDAVTPSLKIQEYIFYAKKHMNLPSYIPGTPVTRRELEDIADWMFVNQQSFRCLSSGLFFDWIEAGIDVGPD